jgi:hypothetical protein
MFKPVRVVATIVFLAMIIMIFISAFVIGSSTLCISKHTSVVASVYLLKRVIQYSSCSSTSRSSGIRCRTSPTPAAPSSECSALLKCFISRIRHHTLPSIQHLSGLLISHAVTSNLFCPGQLYRFYLLRSKKLTIYYESEVVKLLASISQFNISAAFTRKRRKKTLQQMWT